MKDYLPFFRHLLQFTAGVLVAQGALDADTASELVTSGSALAGAVISLVTIFWYRRSAQNDSAYDSIDR